MRACRALTRTSLATQGEAASWAAQSRRARPAAPAKAREQAHSGSLPQRSLLQGAAASLSKWHWVWRAAGWAPGLACLTVGSWCCTAAGLTSEGWIFEHVVWLCATPLRILAT